MFYLFILAFNEVINQKMSVNTEKMSFKAIYLHLLSIHLFVSTQTIYTVALLCKLSVTPCPAVYSLRCLYICLLSQYVHLYFKGLYFCLSSHIATWRHQSWAGTPGSMAHSQLEPAWVDNVFPQPGHCGTNGPKESMGEEEEMTVHSYS